MSELLKSQQATLLKNVDQQTKEKFEEKQKMFAPGECIFLCITTHTTALNSEAIDFSKVAGLDERTFLLFSPLDIAALKEMVAIPLLYPELFSNFQITPPRGVLFHGPPGTGKTLMGEFCSQILTFKRAHLQLAVPLLIVLLPFSCVKVQTS